MLCTESYDSGAWIQNEAPRLQMGILSFPVAAWTLFRAVVAMVDRSPMLMTHIARQSELALIQF